MPKPVEIGGVVYANASATMLARILGADGNPLIPSTIATAVYSIVSLDPSNPQLETAVTGHTAVGLSPPSILFGALQTGGLWDSDLVGFNFSHALDVSVNQAFPCPGVWYRLRYLLTPIAGQPIPLRFKVRAAA